MALVRRWGGVLEHPAHSRLWDHCGLPGPNQGVRGGLWTMLVDQSWWGDKRSKKTWLLIGGIDPVDLPEIPFRLHDPRGDRGRWNSLSKRNRAATPPAMAEWLVAVAKSAQKGAF